MLLFLRSAAGYLGMVALFYATAHGSQGDVSIINKMSPFIVLLLAALFLREKIAGYQIAGLLLAFLGAAFVLNPQLCVCGGRPGAFDVFLRFCQSVGGQHF